MKKQGQDKLLLKWVRSGIGFPRKQKEMVRSLGLRRLNQVVECPDNAQTRGLVASIPHLVTVVGATPAPAWARVAEYKIGEPPAAAPDAAPGKAEGTEQPQEDAAGEGAGAANKERG